MSDDLVDNTQRRNDNNQRQIGVGGGNQMNPMPNPPPPSPPLARRILVISNENDIVSFLSDISRIYNQAIYILSGKGYVKQAIVTTLPIPSLQQFSPQANGDGVGNESILHLSGWFQPIMMDTSAAPLLVSRPNGILHVSLSNIPHSVCVAQSLIPLACVEVFVVFACGPGSAVQPDAPGAEPARVFYISKSRELISNSIYG